MIDIGIIGAGPAGLAAAIYVQRAGKHAVLFEAQSYGGKIINVQKIANYPAIKEISGYEFATNLYEQAIALGAEVKTARVAGIEDKGDSKVLKTSEGNYEVRAVIIATGASNKPLGVSNEALYLGKGVSYCATCDGAFFKGRDVAVVGGGDTAFEDALFLTNYCNKVYLIHRRDEFKANETTIAELKNKDNVEFVLNSTVDKLNGTNKLESIEIVDKDGNKRTIEVAGIFIAVGQAPSNTAFENVVSLDKIGFIEAAEDCTTKTPGVFVAGDTRTKKVRQLTTACADGAVAALAACNYIK